MAIDINDPKAYYVRFYDYGVSNQIACMGRSVEQIMSGDRSCNRVTGPYLRDEADATYEKLKNEVRLRSTVFN